MKNEEKDRKNKNINRHAREEINRNSKTRTTKKNKEKEDKKNKNTGKKAIPKLDKSLTSKQKKQRKISSDEEIENECLEEENSFDEDDVVALDRNFKVKDYVLVKFDTKKTVYHYVGQIKEVRHSMATIKFMRMSKIRNTFMYPEIEDISSVPLKDIKTKLPNPKIWVKRGSSKYTFDKPIWVIPNLR
ncbi:unnamed protein product [Arctia plantaginis]|uniref:Uncharacterized protein n=1 Tax=Arctia plantaginis TaxID=874455 RepID=A0A8S1AZR0_ARCPL|nr:unnamed protein product [Arctia plantaginis]